MKIACVVHRFGIDIAGGSEGHCRLVAEHLAERHDLTVLTSCARDHVTWANAYPSGESLHGPLRVHRFPVVRSRSLPRFAELSEIVATGRASVDEQEQWFRENGPEMPALLEFLDRRGDEFDRVLFWSFRYYQSFFGLPLVADRSILVPTAEDDEIVRLELTRDLFLKAAGFLFLTPEEATLVEECAGRPLVPSSIVGTGLEPARAASGEAVERLGLTPPFILFLGRVDPNKGCGTLVRFFLRHQRATGSQVPLVLAGPVNMPVPEHPLVRALGYVADETREALLWHASVLAMPSRFESLSLVLLEAWNHGRPALVNGHCAVLKGQALRANGALYYRNYEDFAYTLDYLLAHPDAANTLGAQGLEYVNSEYRWPQVMGRIEELLQAAGRRGAQAQSHGETDNTKEAGPNLHAPRGTPSG